MSTTDRKMLEIARKADLRAKKLILSEKLNTCVTTDEYLSISRELDIISHHLECIKVRQDLRGSENESMKMKINRSSKEKSLTKTCR